MIQALTAAALWGCTDAFAGLSTRRATPLIAALWLHVASLLVLAPFVIANLAVSPEVASVGVTAGLVGAIGDVLLGRALAKSAMSVGIPLSNAIAAAIPVVVVVIQGEHMTALGGFGVVGAIAASGLAAAPSNGHLAVRGAGYATAAGTCFGIMYALLAQVAAADKLVVIFVMRLAGTLLLLPGLFQSRQRSIAAVRSGALAGIASGFTSVGANALYISALTSGGSRVAASVLAIALSTPAAVLIAHWATRERLTVLQGASAGSAVVAIAVLAVQSSASMA